MQVQFRGDEKCNVRLSKLGFENCEIVDVSGATGTIPSYLNFVFPWTIVISSTIFASKPTKSAHQEAACDFGGIIVDPPRPEFKRESFSLPNNDGFLLNCFPHG